LHLNDIFHGDLKPENLMTSNQIITIDAGSLLFMQPERLFEEIYCVETVTRSFASSEHF
jgi:tRNA A-37 threonylcarbamoyl transferase component Bud32